MSYDFEAANDAALFFGMGDWYFLTNEGKEALHREKQSLPSFGEEARMARERNLNRVLVRKLKTINKGKDHETH